MALEVAAMVLGGVPHQTPLPPWGHEDELYVAVPLLVWQGLQQRVLQLEHEVTLAQSGKSALVCEIERLREGQNQDGRDWQKGQVDLADLLFGDERYRSSWR